VNAPKCARLYAREGFCQALKGIAVQYAQACTYARESTIKNVAISMTCFEKQSELIRRRDHAQR
jgi:hypothetical protein